MLYLIGQITAFLVIATLGGMILGWWGRGLRQPKLPVNTLPLTTDPFEARSRLEQCHRDNANLRRDLKEAEDHLTKLRAQLDTVSSDTDLVMRLQATEDRVSALLQDLQWRDDTIAALERELAQLRTTR
ncbi:MAG: hypothetical protein WAQ53_08750 [Thiofilum sp.]|uniref:hypothetical protein n=1 Tax=Thiofilum sp. TaxID=2212733 RepID=UPI0025EC37CD|nr:hypothetical protein [Thiofilum sp.]MBK8452807.1 hypothetical protein [Thiofilum sp.]